MHLELRYFASLRDAMKRDGDGLDVPDASTVAGVVDLMCERDPVFAETLGGMSRVRFAVNRRFAAPGVVLHDADELAIFPPITGG